MRSERCTSGSEGERQKPTAATPYGADARPLLSAKLPDGRWFRALTVHARMPGALVVDRALNGHRVALAPSQVVAERRSSWTTTKSKKAIAPNEHTFAVACRASTSGYGSATFEKTMHRRGSLRVGAPARVRSRSSPADAALDRRRHCG